MSNNVPEAKAVAMAPHIRLEGQEEKVEGDEYACWMVNGRLRWGVKCTRRNMRGELITMQGKEGPEWDFTKDPYATVGGKIILNFIDHIKRVYVVIDIHKKGVLAALERGPSLNEPSLSVIEPTWGFFKHSEYTTLLGFDTQHVQMEDDKENIGKVDIRRRDDEIVSRRRSVLNNEPNPMKTYQEPGVVPVEFTYMFCKCNRPSMRGRAKFVLEPRRYQGTIKYKIVKRETKHMTVRK